MACGSERKEKNQIDASSIEHFVDGRYGLLNQFSKFRDATDGRNSSWSQAADGVFSFELHEPVSWKRDAKIFMRPNCDRSLMRNGQIRIRSLAIDETIREIVGLGQRSITAKLSPALVKMPMVD